VDKIFFLINLNFPVFMYATCQASVSYAACSYTLTDDMVCVFFINNPYIFGFEVLTAVAMNNTMAWDVTPCYLVELRTRFRIKLLASSSPASLLSSIILILSKEAVYSSEMWVNFYRATGHRMLQAVFNQQIVL
jgi:hypothetical protein